MEFCYQCARSFHRLPLHPHQGKRILAIFAEEYAQFANYQVIIVLDDCKRNISEAYVQCFYAECVFGFPKEICLFRESRNRDVGH